MIAVRESDISAKANFLISRLKWLTDTAFFKPGTNFEVCADETLLYDHSNERYWALLYL